MFPFSCHTFYKVVIGLFYLSCVSHSLFELLVLAHHTTWLLIQLTSQLFSASTMFLFPYILLFCHSSFFSLIHLCLNSFLFTVSLYFIVSATFTPSINGSTQFLTYHLNLFSSILIHPSQLINPLPPISLLRYTLSTALLGCSAPCIVINFLFLLSKLFNSSVFYLRILAPYLNTENAQVSTAIILFLPFNFDLNISLNHRSSFLSL